MIGGIIYVWIDALINYLSGTGYGTDPAWENIWNSKTEKIHVIGKNVWKFHAVYWPALLLAAGLPLPDKIFVHGFLTIDGRKISKSPGNTVDPFDCIEQFGSDTLRFYLLGEVSPVQDGDFTFTKLKTLYNSRFANGIGNLVSRITTLCRRKNRQIQFFGPLQQLPAEYGSYLENFQFDKALNYTWKRLDALNQDIDRIKPRELLKNDPEDFLTPPLQEWMTGLHTFIHLISPFLPDTAERIGKRLTTADTEKEELLFPRMR